MDQEELSAASKHFDCVSLLSDIKPGDFVTYRYSLYPFAQDQEREILNIGATPINTFNQHRYVADLENYVIDLGTLTPLTWNRIQDIPEIGPFIVKGETNSRKSSWKKHMFAQNKAEAIEVYGLLCDDALICQQKIFVRQYVPLVTYTYGIGGVPITEEYRFFAAFGKIIAGGYYWQNYVDDLDFVPDYKQVPEDFLNKVLNLIDNKINFVVIDIARTQAGEWIVIELNDGCQSGLSCIDPESLYQNLKKSIIHKGL